MAGGDSGALGRETAQADGIQVSECPIWGADPVGTNDTACVRVADFDRDTFGVDLSSLTLRHVDFTSTFDSQAPSR